MTTKNDEGGEIRIGTTNHPGVAILSIRFKTVDGADLLSDPFPAPIGSEIVSVKIIPADDKAAPNKSTEYTILDDENFDLLCGIGIGLERYERVMDCPRLSTGAPVVITTPIRVSIAKAGKNHAGLILITVK